MSIKNLSNVIINKGLCMSVDSTIVTKHKNIARMVYMSVVADQKKKYGMIWAIKKLVIVKYFNLLSWLILLPLAIPMHYLGFRRLLIRIEHIGHLTLECDSFIKEKRLGLLPKNKRFYFILAPKSTLSNPHLLSYWNEHFTFITNPVACVFLGALTRKYFMRYDVSRYVSAFFGTQDIYRINQLWGTTPPLLSLTDEDESWGKQQLNPLGILPGQWFVCLHVREGGFLPDNELIQLHRNASIANTYLAIEEIVRRGGIVVRMGDASMSVLPKMQGVIDYAHHPLKSDRLDVILCAKARFFLGCTSGLAFLSMVFGVPVAHANMIPVETLGISANDISIPKLVFDEGKQRILNFKELFSSDVGGFFFTHQYKETNMTCIENTADEILNLAQEILDRLDGLFIENEEDKQLHEAYMSLFKPGHFSYGAVSRIGIAFLRKHKHLLFSNHSIESRNAFCQE